MQLIVAAQEVVLERLLCGVAQQGDVGGANALALHSVHELALREPSRCAHARPNPPAPLNEPETTTKLSHGRRTCHGARQARASSGDLAGALAVVFAQCLNSTPRGLYAGFFWPAAPSGGAHEDPSRANLEERMACTL